MSEPTRPGVTNGSRVSDVQQEVNTLGEILCDNGAILPQKAKALSSPASKADIPQALRDQGVDDDAITDAMYRRFSPRFALFNPELHLTDQAVRSGPREGDWIISKGVFWLVNPYDPQANEAMKRVKANNAKTDPRYAWTTLGIMSPIQFQKASQVVHVEVSDATGDVASDDPAAEKAAETLFNTIMETACSREASDVHLNPGKQLQVKMRIDGKMTGVMALPMDAKFKRLANLLMSKCQKEATYNMPADGEFRYEYNQKTVSVRLAMCPCKTGNGMEPRFTMRLNGLHTSRKSIGHLGFSEKQVDLLRRFSHMPHGLVLVTGPTGSGKSTTLYALLRDISMHSPYKSIFTLEDPVEQLIPDFQQIEIRGKMVFADGLKSLLRMDPDVILVGEIRDDETANLALKGANTGHLVFSTLHTNNSHESLERMMDLGCKRSFLAGALKGVTAQRMVDLVCTSCSTKKPMNDVPEYVKKYGSLPLWKPDQIVRIAKQGGCAQCNNTGYRGRHPVQEIFLMDAMARDMLLEGAIPAQIRESQIAAGTFETLWVDGYRLVADGKTTFEALEDKLDQEEAMAVKETIAAIKKANLSSLSPQVGRGSAAGTGTVGARTRITQLPAK